MSSRVPVSSAEGTLTHASRWFEAVMGLPEVQLRQSDFSCLLRRAPNGDIFYRNPKTGDVHNCGQFSMPTLAELCPSAAAALSASASVPAPSGPGTPDPHPRPWPRPPVLEVRTAAPSARAWVDVGAVQALPSSAGFLFQVASNFNAVEAPSSAHSPARLDFLSAYCYDRTQGPRASIFAGGAAVARVLWPWLYGLPPSAAATAAATPTAAAMGTGIGAGSAGPSEGWEDGIAPLSVPWDPTTLPTPIPAPAASALPAHAPGSASLPAAPAGTYARWGQTHARQVCALAGARAHFPVRNGYVVLPTQTPAPAPSPALGDAAVDESERAALLARGRVMLHRNCPITFQPAPPASAAPYTASPTPYMGKGDPDALLTVPPTRAHAVDQVFAAALNTLEPCSGNGRDRAEDTRARRALLELAYEGTYAAARACQSKQLVLTLVGGGVFGNPLGDIAVALAAAHAAHPHHTAATTSTRKAHGGGGGAAAAGDLERVTLLIYSGLDHLDGRGEPLFAQLRAQGIPHEWVHYTEKGPETRMKWEPAAAAI